MDEHSSLLADEVGERCDGIHDLCDDRCCPRSVLQTSTIFDARVRKAVATTSHGMSKAIPIVTDADFEQEVLKSPLPVLLDFTADWCSPCRTLEPVVEKIAEHHAGTVRVLKIDADASASIAARYGVRALPTVISFVDGQVHKRHTGATTMATLLRLLPNTLAATD
jgi:thioredoxin 1